MSSFTEAEIEYLGGQPLGRLATVGADGRPQVKPVGSCWSSGPTSSSS